MRRMFVLAAACVCVAFLGAAGFCESFMGEDAAGEAETQMGQGLEDEMAAESADGGIVMDEMQTSVDTGTRPEV